MTYYIWYDIDFLDHLMRVLDKMTDNRQVICTGSAYIYKLGTDKKLCATTSKQSRTISTPKNLTIPVRLISRLVSTAGIIWNIEHPPPAVLSLKYPKRSANEWEKK